MAMTDRWTCALAAAALVAGLAGCQCASSDEGTSAPTEVDEDGIPMGTIEGIVRLAPTSGTPSYAENPMARETTAPIPEECPPPRSSDREPLAMADDRGLASVPVVAIGDPTRWPAVAAPRTVDVHIRQCRLDPTVITATVGDVLEVHNDLMYPFFPVLGSGGFMQAVLPGEARVFELDAARPMTLQCSMTSPCGRAEILVLSSPVHTVSGEGGRFTIEVPADQDVELVAWHPVLQESSVHVTVGAGATARVEIVVEAAPLPDAHDEGDVEWPAGERPEDHPELGPF